MPGPYADTPSAHQRAPVQRRQSRRCQCRRRHGVSAAGPAGTPTPRKLTMATRAMNARATIETRMPSPRSRSKALAKLAANARDAVDADVIPELITAKATMNVRKWMPNALCVYSAAPAALGTW